MFEFAFSSAGRISRGSAGIILGRCGEGEAAPSHVGAGVYLGRCRLLLGRCRMHWLLGSKRPTRSNGRWCRPIRTIRRSTPSAPRCARSTRTCRRLCPGIARSSALRRNGGYNYNNCDAAVPVGGAADARSVRADISTRAPSAPRRHRRCSTATRPPIAPGRPKARSMRARETLRVTEQQVLLDAATAYMNLLRDRRDPRAQPAATSKSSPSSSSRRATASMSAR